MDNLIKSTEDFEREFGEQFRQMRIRIGLDQKELASRANVSLGALMNLENGRGSTLKTLIKLLRALDRQDWLKQLAPQVEISPMALLNAQNKKTPRRKVYRARKHEG